MNIGIMTFYHGSENYGAVLQAYALNRYLSNEYPQHYVETVDYSMKNETGGYFSKNKKYN